MKNFLVVLLLFITFTGRVWAETKPLSVGILLYPDVQIIDYTGPYEIFGWAGYKVTTVSEDGKPLSTNMKMKVVPDYSFKNAPQFDIVLIPGGDHHKAMHNKATLGWIKAQSTAAQTILSVCTGAYILAETGLLDNLSATTFYPALRNFKKDYPKITTITNQRFVDNGKVITAAGLSSGIDAALHVVAKYQGIEKAKSIAMSVEYDWKAEKGFVRGNMADVQLQSVGGLLPKQLRFDEVYSYGSESEWLASYNVSAEQALTLNGVSESLADAIALTKEWVPKQGQPNTWRKKSASGELWLLDITYTQDKESLQLALHLRHE
jgi:putative intracellular protease/amidase